MSYPGTWEKHEYSNNNGLILCDGKEMTVDEVVSELKNDQWLLMKADRKIDLLYSQVPKTSPLIKYGPKKYREK